MHTLPDDRLALQKKHLVCLSKLSPARHLTVYEKLEVPLSYRDARAPRQASVRCARSLPEWERRILSKPAFGGSSSCRRCARWGVASPGIILADDRPATCTRIGPGIMELFKTLNTRDDNHPGDTPETNEQ